MCKHCEDERLHWEKWEPIEAPEQGWGPMGGPRCLYSNDLFGEPEEDGELEGCPFEAEWRFLSTDPVDHLCEQHKAERERVDGDEHGEVPGPIGLDIDRFLAIEAEESCEAFDEETMRDCGRGAVWVSMDTYDMEACEGHYARETG